MKVEAGFDGLVIDSGNSEKWNEGKGGYVTIQDVHTLKVTTYSHLSEIYVKSGDFIEKGEVLGSAGSSGDILPGGACQVGIARD
jgi:murein DD-endopeptidase MepM/ murein hydrolase activator NlpD